MPHLLLTGDDFGRSAAVNEAIAQFHAAGALTQASLMVNEPGAEEAARIAARHPRLCVGLHLTLCAGRASAVSALTDAHGQLDPSPARAGWRYALRRKLQAPLSAEIERQFARFRALGFPPTYWDGHTHLHLHPTVLRLTLPIAERHGFRVTRLVREPGSWRLNPAVFRALSRAAIPRLRERRMEFGDAVFGLSKTGQITARTFAHAFDRLPEGWSEFYFHPGAEPALPSPDQLAALLAARPIIRANSTDLLAARSR